MNTPNIFDYYKQEKYFLTQTHGSKSQPQPRSISIQPKTTDPPLLKPPSKDLIDHPSELSKLKTIF